MRLHLAVIAILLACSPASSVSGQVPSPSGVLAGVVVDDRGHAVPHARIWLRHKESVTEIDGTADGRFQTTVAANVEYELQVGRPGYVTNGGQQKTHARVKLERGARRDVVIRLVRAATIRGTFTMLGGAPALGGFITAIPAGSSSEVSSIGSGGQVRSDGSYEIGNLPPGSYVVVGAMLLDGIGRFQASRDATRTSSYLPAFYGQGGGRDRAQTIRLEAGDVRHGADLVLRAAAFSAVDISIVPAMPIEPGSLKVAFEPVDSYARMFPGSGVSATNSGLNTPSQPERIRREELRPGDYILTAHATFADGSLGHGTAEVVLTPGETTSVSLDVGRGLPLAMTLVSDGPAVSFGPFSVDSYVDVLRIKDDGRTTNVELPWGRGTTRTLSVSPGSYVAAVLSDGPHVVRRVLLGSRDVTDRIFELTEASSLTIEVSTTPLGALTGRGSPNQEGRAALVLFPVDPDQRYRDSRRIRVTYPEPNGDFFFDALPSGQYFLAVAGVPAPNIQDSALLSMLERAAMRISLEHGETKVTTIR